MINGLADLIGTNGFAIDGIAPGDQAGYSVAGIGDINNDGFDDVAVGARFAPDPSVGNDTGEVYVVFGSPSGFPEVIDPSVLDGSDGFILTGETSNTYTGSSVSRAGDLNGDGIDDLIIGAQGADAPSPDGGAAYVIFGSDSGFPAELSLNAALSLNGSNGFRIEPESRGQELGVSVASAGDVNGDGFDDVIVGAHSYNSSSLAGLEPGSAYVVFGSGSGFSATLGVGGLDGSNGFQVLGETADDRFGRAVSGAGDINNDGIDDLIIGAPEVDGIGAPDSGAVYVVYGTTTGFSATISAASLAGSAGFKIEGFSAGDQAGLSVANLGDVNGDAIDDLAIGVFGGDPLGRPDAGEVYVVYGTPSGFGNGVDVSTLDGSNGFVVYGAVSGAFTGYAVASAGDVNSDGLNDVLFGAHGASVNGNGNAGKIYVVYGRSGLVDAGFDLETLNSLTGFLIDGVDTDDIAGVANNGAFDVNGDGISDIIAGANLADATGNLKPEAGQAFVVFGPGAPLVSIYQDASFSSLLSHHYDFSEALAAVAAGEALDVTLPDAIGDVGVQSVLAEGITILGDGPFTGSFVLDPSVLSFALRGSTIASVNGNSANNVITGSDAANMLNGVGGADRLIGALGSDTLNGGAGSDTLFGGLGDDQILAGDDNDRASGGGGADVLDGGTGDDTLLGLGGSDTISGGVGDDTIRGGAGSDTLQGEAGDDVIFAGAGADVSVSGGAGSDSLYGEGGDDVLDGNEDDDLIFGGNGADTLNGGDGNDTLYGSDGADRLVGGDGSDRLTGGNAFDQLLGGTGIDYLSGGVGNDSLDGGADADTLIGGSGEDSLFGGTGDDIIKGGGDADQIDGGEGNDDIDAGAGGDVVLGTAGLDTINGGSGDDLIDGGADADSLLGGGGADTLFGGSGDDSLSGGGVADMLNGGLGADTVNGGNGADTLMVASGEGGDELTGGSGSDTFVFEVGFGAAAVTDFNDAVDKLDFSDFGFVNVSDFASNSSDVGTSVVFSLAGDQLTIDNWSLAQLDAGDLVL